MAACFSGVLNNNHWFKNQKIRLRRFVSGNDQDFVEIGVMEPKIAIDNWYQEKNGGERKERKRKGRKREEKGIRRKKCF